MKTNYLVQKSGPEVERCVAVLICLGHQSVHEIYLDE